MKKLLGSAPSQEALKKVVSNFFLSNSISFVPCGDKTYSVHNTKGAIADVVVRERKGRWRFELKGESK